jgi:hypothetical protein
MALRRRGRLRRQRNRGKKSKWQPWRGRWQYHCRRGRRWSALRWMSGDRSEIERWATGNRSDTAEDHDGEYVALFSSDWRRKRAEEDYPKLKFHAVREQHGVVQMAR